MSKVYTLASLLIIALLSQSADAMNLNREKVYSIAKWTLGACVLGYASYQIYTTYFPSHTRIDTTKTPIEKNDQIIAKKTANPLHQHIIDLYNVGTPEERRAALSSFNHIQSFSSNIKHALPISKEKYEAAQKRYQETHDTNDSWSLKKDLNYVFVENKNAYYHYTPAPSGLFTDKFTQQIVTAARELLMYKAKNPGIKICALGQSFSYIVLAAQFIETLQQTKSQDYLYIALSNDDKLFKHNQSQNTIDYTLPPTEAITHYYNYLKQIGFISKENQTVMICDFIVSGRSFIQFEALLNKIRDLLKPEEKLPIIKYCGYTEHQQVLAKNVPQFNYQLSTDFYGNNFKDAWSILINNAIFNQKLQYIPCKDLRLIPHYAPDEWKTTDPHAKPQPFALAYAMRIFDYLKRNPKEIPGNQVQQ